MLSKIKNSFLFRQYLTLPLWGKIVAPVAVFILFSWLVSLFKMAFGVALVVGIIYLVMRATNAFGK